MKVITDIDRINFIEERARLSRAYVYVAFNWAGRGNYVYIENQDKKSEGGTIRQAIDQAIEKHRSRKK